MVDGPRSARRRIGTVLAILAVASIATGCGVATGPDGPAYWRLDPAYPSPNAGSIVIHVLAEESACASETSPIGRMESPRVQVDAASVTITIEVRQLSGDVNCPSNPEVPVTVWLWQPLGDRRLVDGSRGTVVAPPTPTPSAPTPPAP